MSQVKTYVFYILGCLFIILAVIGAIMPIIPTTPFLLLALFFLSEVSPKLHKKILQVPIFGRALRDWEENRVIRPKVKLEATILLAISGGYIWYFRDQIDIYLKGIISLTLILICFFILKQKSR